MGIVVLPLDASSGSPSYSAQATRQAFSALMGLAPSGRPLGATSGVRPGTPTTTVTITNNTTWNVAAHAGVLDVESSPLAAPYMYATTGGDSGTITAANATYARVDIVYVQVSDNVQDSSGSETGAIGYLAGTPAASPTAPATPARSMVLAQITVPAVGGGNPTVSWVAPTWGAVPWTTYTPQWTSSQTNPTIGNSVVQGRYRLLGKTVDFYIRLTIGSTADATGAGTFYFSLPLPISPSTMAAWIPLGGATLQDVSASNRYVRSAVTTGDTNHIALSDDTGTLVTQTVPVSVASSDIITITGTYETA